MHTLHNLDEGTDINLDIRDTVLEIICLGFMALCAISFRLLLLLAIVFFLSALCNS